MKKLLSLLVFTLLAALSLSLSLPAAAQSIGPYVCTGPALVTGTVGTMSGAAPNPQYINNAFNWNGPPAEAFSIGWFTNFGGPAKLSFAAQSGAEVRFGSACTLGGIPCSSFSFARITQLSISTQFQSESAPGGGTQSVAYSRWSTGGVKVMEVRGLGALTSLQSGSTWTDGISRIRQDTGANSSLWIEGWNTVSGVTTWKSVKVKMVSNQCGSL